MKAIHVNKKEVVSSALKVSLKSGFEVIPLDTILYLKADSNYSTFHCIERSPIMVSKPIGSYEEKLSLCGFIRIHKSTIVNMRYIKGYKHFKGHYITLYNDLELQIARRRVSSFIKTMDQYIGEA